MLGKMYQYQKNVKFKLLWGAVFLVLATLHCSTDYLLKAQLDKADSFQPVLLDALNTN